MRKFLFVIAATITTTCSVGQAIQDSLCSASFGANCPVCCPNGWNFTDSSTVGSGDSIVSWLWSFPGGTPSSSTSQNAYTLYPAIGMYTACLIITTLNGCIDSACQTINVLALSVDQKESDIGVIAFPNPCYSQATLQTAVPLRDATLTVENYLGQAVRQTNHLSGQAISFERANLPAGLYIFRLKQNSKIIATGKLVIADQ